MGMLQPDMGQLRGVALRRVSLWRQMREHRWSYLFILPMVVLTVTFSWYPLFASIRYAFYNWTGFGEPTEFVGFRHFVNVATDSFFWQAFRNTLVYTAIQVPIQLLLALTLALILNNKALKLSSAFRAIFFIPVVCSIAVLAVPLKNLFALLSSSMPPAIVQAGLFNPSLGFLGDPKWAMASVIGVGIWHTFGYNLVFFLAALQSVPEELYEAATVDGAGRWAKFRYITIPLIQPVGIIIVFLALLGSMRVFELVLVLTNGGPFFATEVVSTYIYSYAFSPRQVNIKPNLGYASAASMFMSILLLGLTALQVWSIGRARTRRRELGLE
jgi:multiple sugar transport system permease protein